MPSDGSRPQPAARPDTLTGRCYCGRCTFRVSAAPSVVSYCHCADCRRWTGGPVAAFAAVSPGSLTSEPALGAGFSAVPGVTRWMCPDCGSPLACRFDYLPNQIYIPLGVIEEADQLAPELHSYASRRLPWLHIADDIPRHETSGQDALCK